MKLKAAGKANRILELSSQGLTPTEIMKQTGFSLAWIREVIMRADVWEEEKR